MRVPGKVVLCRVIGDGSDGDSYRPEVADEVAPDGQGLPGWWVFAIESQFHGLAIVKVPTEFPLDRDPAVVLPWLNTLKDSPKYVVLGNHEAGFFGQPWSDVPAAQRAKVDAFVAARGWPTPPLGWTIKGVVKALAARMGTEIDDPVRDVG